MIGGSKETPEEDPEALVRNRARDAAEPASMPKICLPDGHKLCVENRDE